MALGTGQAQFLQQVRQAELLGGPQSDVLDADAAGPRPAAANPRRRLWKSVWGAAFRDGSGSDAGWWSWTPSRSRRSAMRWASASTAGGASRGRRAGPRGEDLLDAPAESAPVLTPDGEPGAEVEQRLLADLGADPPGTDETVGEVGLAAVGTGPGAADEHAPSASRKTGGVNPCGHFMVLHYRFWDVPPIESTTYGSKRLKFGRNRPSADKLGLEGDRSPRAG